MEWHRFISRLLDKTLRVGDRMFLSSGSRFYPDDRKWFFFLCILGEIVAIVRSTLNNCSEGITILPLWIWSECGIEHNPSQSVILIEMTKTLLIFSFALDTLRTSSLVDYYLLIYRQQIFLVSIDKTTTLRRHSAHPANTNPIRWQNKMNKNPKKIPSATYRKIDNSQT